MSHFLVYVRRSLRTSGDADVSDEAQVAAAVAILPAGATHEVLADSGGHHSGRSGDRDGFRELVARIRDGRCDGVAAYDLSRLARNARLILELHHAIEAARIPLLLANMPGARFDTATGRFMLGQLALAAQFQADQDSERARAIRQALYEDGYHRGLPPFGYRNGRDDRKRRILVVEPGEADIVRRIFAELATRSLYEIAEDLNRDGAPAPGRQGWTPYAVRDVYRRAKVYLGLVVLRRGLDERAGRHEPIITPELERAAIAGMASRGHGGRRAGPGRTYLLTGVLRCDCGRTMPGSLNNGRWRYYVCRYCRRPAIRADELEAKVLDAIRSYRLPARTIELAREELRRRLAGPRDDTIARQRRRLEGRLVALRKQHAWRDIDDAEYLREKAATERMLASLPDEDKLVSFDRHRAQVLAMSETVERMTPEERRDVVRLFVEKVNRAGRIWWTGPVRPFYALAVGATDSVSPQGSEHTVSADRDELAWYAS